MNNTKEGLVRYLDNEYDDDDQLIAVIWDGDTIEAIAGKAIDRDDMDRIFTILKEDCAYISQKEVEEAIKEVIG